ncbi:MAG TPA: ABC transporter ATP-binding protein [Terriglobales bacterium]|nr:ABC transporter ATP-binding protein [Terriglobales bacterium]
MQTALLRIRISADYANKPGVLQDICLEMGRGEILGLVGESGCGKSTLSLAILGLLGLKGGRVSGEIHLNGRELLSLGERELRKLRGKELALVLQSPMSALNPALRLGKQLSEAWYVHQSGTREQCEAAIAAALENVSLPSDKAFFKRFPSQISVGQAQRVLIAMSILHRPPLIIADEPTSALDLITQSEILQLFSDLSRKLGMSILYISHDLLSVATISQRIAVMNQGSIIECRPTPDIFRDPTHPYTRQLIRALPVIPQSFAAAVL